MRGLLIEQVPGALRKLQDSDPLFHIRFIRRLMLLDRIQEAVLFGAPFARLPVEEGDVDPSIKFIFVKRFKPIEQPLVIGLQSRNGRFMVLPLVRLAFAEGRRNPFDDLLIQSQLTKPPRKLCLKRFLSEIRFLALSLKTSAVIVHVLLLLDLSDERTAAVTAAEKTGIGEAMLRLLAPSSQAPIKRRLNVVPELPGDERFMGSLENAPGPIELA